MKKLQNNFTTPEQSKRLLELGVPADSADLLYIQDAITIEDYIMVRNEDESICDFIENNICIKPCWSVGRLIEINLLCAEEPTNFVTNVIFFKGNNMSNIEVIIDSIKTTSMDFSKLEQ